MSRRRFFPLPAAFGFVVVVAALSTPAGATGVQTVFVIAMENTNWTQPAGQSIQQIFGNPAALFLNGLVNGTLATTVSDQTITSQTAYANAYHNVLATPSGSNPSIHPSELTVTTSGVRAARTMACSTTTSRMARAAPIRSHPSISAAIWLRPERPSSRTRKAPTSRVPARP